MVTTLPFTAAQSRLDDAGGAIVDHLVCAEHVATECNGLRTTRRGDDAASMQTRQLNRDVSHAAGSGVNENGLARLNACAQVKSFPRSLAHQRQGRRSDMIHRARLAGGASCVDRNVVGVCSIAKEIRGGEDFIARLPRIHPLAALHDDTAHVVSQNDREFPVAAALANFRVYRVDRCRVHFDEHVGLSQFGVGAFFQPEHVGAAVLAYHHRSHACLSVGPVFSEASLQYGIRRVR
jgi:hypothetical protein